MQKSPTRSTRATTARPPRQRIVRRTSVPLAVALLAVLLVQLLLSGAVAAQPNRQSAEPSPAQVDQPTAAPELTATPENPEIAPTATVTETAAAEVMPPDATVLPVVSNEIPVADTQPSFPIRAAFYYPWFPDAWTQGGVYPFTNYNPSLGFYDGGDAAIIKQQIAAMQYGGISAGILSWWGQGHHTDLRVPAVLAATAGNPFRWAVYHEGESQGNPSAAAIASDLAYLRDRYGSDPSFLRINGRFVVFVYADGADACGMADRWIQGNAGINAYIVLKVFPGYAQCASQPDNWHQYSPAVAADSQGSRSYAISPGFYLKGQAVRLGRDLNRWQQNVRDMVASGAQFQLVTTFNEWGEGTSVESAQEWASASGYGAYLDALHNNGNAPAPATNTPVPPTATNTPAPPTAAPTNTQVPATSTSAPVGSALTLNPAADAYVDSGAPTTNYGALTQIRVDASPAVQSLLRFNVQGLSATVTSAVLRIYANSSQSTGFGVYRSSGSWTETGVNYNNRPALGASLGQSGAATAGSWKEVNVTAAVTGNGTYDFILTTSSSTALSLGSRESANPPQLVVQTGSTSVTSTPAPTNTPPANTATPTRTPPPSTATPTGVPSTCNAVNLTKGPILILTGSNTSMKVSWQWSSNTTFTLQWGTTTAYSTGSASVNPSDTTNRMYSYTITGLTPGTKYYYRAVVGSQCASGTFYAPPASSATDLKFFAYGDTRTNGGTHNTLAGRVISRYQADPAFQTFNIHVGDWVNGDTEAYWTAEWFNSSYGNIRTQDANIADTGVRGNHEGGATYWKRYFPQPYQPGGLYRSFDYGPVHVAMIDQYTAYNAGSTQYNWLKNDLAASTKKWKFVVLHEPGWSAGGGHGNNTTVQKDLQPLFQQYGVSIVFGGHNHYYARAVVSGIQHLTVGGGGAPLASPSTSYPNIVTMSKNYSYSEFTISGSTLTAKVLSSTGATLDSFTLTR